MAESKSVAKLERTLDGYLSGQSGIKFDVIARFAEPLFDLYELEPRSGLERGSEARSASELAMMLSVLETARLFELRDELLERPGAYDTRIFRRSSHELLHDG